MTNPSPRIAVLPMVDDGIEDAVTTGGGIMSSPEDADGLIWMTPGDPEGLRAALDRSPARWVQLPFAGIEAFVGAGVVDRARTWTCAKDVYGPATAEHALALLLAAARLIPTHARATSWRAGGLDSPERRLADSTVLVVGTGGIGRSLATMLGPLSSRLVAVNRSGRALAGAHKTVEHDRLAEVLPEADLVVLAAPVTEETTGLIDGSALSHMKRDAWLINVARGRLVVTDDLVAALRGGTLGGACLDVTDPEPLPDGHPLWTLPNVLITPHVANTWEMGLRVLRDLVRSNVERFRRGAPLAGVVDPELGY